MITKKDDLGIIGVVVEDWDIRKAFRPKTITTDYSTWTTYISRKPVPENTPITDTEYWKPIARSSGQPGGDYNEFKQQTNERLTALEYNVNYILDYLGLHPTPPTPTPEQWTFGDAFPIVLASSSSKKWNFGENLPLYLNNNI